jgi:hypothetical protein
MPQNEGKMKPNNYGKFLLMLSISFVIMYVVMFLNIARIEHFYLSLTRFYMTLLMVAPMAVVMLLMMPMMYHDKKLNAIIMVSAVAVFGLALYGLRQQVFISEEQYMKAMIPHHSSAILVSKHANLQDPELKKLAEQIIESQEKEIAEMENHLMRLKK